MGPFEAQGWLASGGMGDVWRGLHAAQGVPVAIKVLRRNTSDTLPFRTVFLREVRAVANLDHPCIINLFDIGEVSEAAAAVSAGALDVGNPYLVMEYLEDGSLDSLQLPLPWVEAREILLAVLDGLAHAHARGITHRDLKPANILLDDGFGGSPVRLTDFGIAFSPQMDRSDEAAGTTVGTPTYMAPEQFVGDWREFGPWTDLYALGCVAYELAAGRVPFEEVQVVKLGMAHLSDTPPEFECPPDYPSGYQDWVSRLLEKEPRDRFVRCSDAARELASFTAPSSSGAPGGFDGETEPDAPLATFAVSLAGLEAETDVDWRVASQPRPPFRFVGAGLRLFGLKHVPMVDRDSERDLLWDTFGRVTRTGKSRIVVLEGSAGTGKSRLAEWLHERTHEMGLADCLKAEHDGSGGRGVSLSHMLASAWSCQDADAEELSKRVEAILSSAGLDSRATRRAVTELLAPASLGDDYSPGMFHEFRARSERFSTLFEVLRGMYVERPLLIWVDDAHWGTDALNFTRYVLERSSFTPLRMMVVLTVRDDLLVESAEASGLLSALCKEDEVQCMQMDALSTGDSRLLVSNMLYLEGDLADRVSARSGGNPLYATQLVGDWVNRGILEAGRSGFVLAGSAQPEMPNDVHALWVQRLGRILEESVDPLSRYPTPAQQRMQMQLALELAAALGGRVDMGEWVSVCSLVDVPRPSRLLDALLASRMARLRDDGWSFSHSMLRDSIERIARESRRWASHNRHCADMLEERHPVPFWGDSERVGRFRFEAGDYDASVVPLLRGVRERIRLEEYSAALELISAISRALDESRAPHDDRRRLEGQLLRAEIYCTRRQLDEAEQIADALRDTASDREHGRYYGGALVLLARVHQEQGKRTKALEEFAEAERALRASAPKQELAACLSEQAHALLEMGLMDRAWRAFNEAQEIFEDTGQLLPWAENQLGLARVLLRQGETDYARTLCRRVRSFARREELARVEAAALALLSEVQTAQRQTREAEESLEQSIELYERLGLERQALQPRLHKVLLLLEAGSLGEAEAEYQLLRGQPATDVPRAPRMLLDCIGFALEADGSAKRFAAGLSDISKDAAETEALNPDVERCLRLASGLARELGFPDRAIEVTNLLRKLAKRTGGSGSRA